MKLLSEEIRLALTFDERRQLDLLLEFSNRWLTAVPAPDSLPQLPGGFPSTTAECVLR
jgi:hypothetical protein